MAGKAGMPRCPLPPARLGKSAKAPSPGGFVDSQPIRRSGALHAVRHFQGHRPRHRRGPHRVHPGVVDRASAAAGALLRLRRRRLRQDLRGPDPARRDPRAAVDLFHPAVGHRHGAAERPRRAAVRDRRAGRVPAGGRGRRAGWRLHQVGAVQPVDRLHRAHHRRLRAAVDRPAGARAALSRRDPVFAADVFRHRLSPNASP